jgi:MFS family permease
MSITLQIISIVFFNFIGYFSIGLQLAVLPGYVDHVLGYGAILAGTTISVQYVATFLSRTPAGRLSDRVGPKQTVIWGLFLCSLSGLFWIFSACSRSLPGLSFSFLLLGRLFLGAGESFLATGSSLWGISQVGSEHTAKVISWNGIATYGALALGAPMGVLMDSHLGFVFIGCLIVSVALLSLPLAIKKPSSKVVIGTPIPIHRVIRAVVPFGLGLTLGSVGFGSIATFITLFYQLHHWPNAAFSLSAFGVAFVSTRLVLGHLIPRYGGAKVAILCLLVESLGLALLWKASSAQWAFLGATLAGIGFSLVFPSLGVEAVSRVNQENRGVALGLYSVFTDVSLGLTGPIGGLMASLWGYSSVFLFAALCALLGTLLILYIKSNHTRSLT